MRLSRSQITIMLALLMAMIMGGNALAQRYDSYYSQQQMQRQQQMQQQQQQQQMQMQRQQEQMRRQQEQARQQQAAIRQQQAEQQRIMRARQQEAQRIMQQQRDQAMQQRQLALDRQRQATSQRVESESRKAAKDQVLAKQQAVDRSALKQQGLEKNRQERLLRLKQDFLQKQRITSGKANIPQPARPLTLSEKFKANSGAKNIATYQPGKQLTTKELAAQRQSVQKAANALKISIANVALLTGKKQAARSAIHIQKLPIYDARTLDRMRADAFHNFPASFETEILSKRPISRPDGRLEYLQQGNINGKEGVFHITTDNGNKVIRHRAFIPKSDWSRYSKRWRLPDFNKIDK